MAALQQAPASAVERPLGPATRFSLPRYHGWQIEVVVLLLWRRHRLDVSRETVRRHLHQAGLVWRRPRPVLRREDPERTQILAGLRSLLQHLPQDETAVFEDEVDVNL